MNKPTLLVMAAGMGSRYGGLKQIDPLGPQGEIIIDYSIYDAILAGFGKVVFVIKRELLDTFKEVIGDRIAEKGPVEYAFQELTDLPAGFSVPEGREKPWGTGHAIYAARKHIDGAFGIIGSDDFFGRDTFMQLGAFCSKHCKADKLAMVGFRLQNTLTENGTVSRGVCQVENGYMTSVTERTKIFRAADGQTYYTEADGDHPVDENAPVSMNVWAFHSDLFPLMEADLIDFLRQEQSDPLKREYFLPAFVDRLVQQGKVTVQMLDTTSRWYGVTHRADRDSMMTYLASLHQEGVYPPLR